MSLKSKKCLPCEGCIAPLATDKIQAYLTEVNSKEKVLKESVNEWMVIENNLKIKKEFIFTNFKEAIIFVNKVAALAEDEGHHPDIHVYYKKVILELWTHAIGGLSENDFIMAAKVDIISS